METITKKRDKSIDTLRGFAIMIMLFANLIGHIAPVDTHPVWTRYFNSIAAPLFILLVGYMIAYTSELKGHTLIYYLKRGGLMLVTAALIDMLCWQTIPFITYDVLYLIGFSIPVVYLYHKLSIPYKLLIFSVIIICTPLLQSVFGYTDFPGEMSLTGELTLKVKNPTPVLNHFLIDGWFPIFPWLAFSFLGSLLKDLESKSQLLFSNTMLILFAVTTLIGYLWFSRVDFSNVITDRNGYTELFYPATLSFMFMVISFILLVWNIVKRIEGRSFLFPAEVFGNVSLFIYILHTVLISMIVDTMFYDSVTDTITGNFTTAVLFYFLLLLVCFIPALLLRWIKKKYKIQNYFFRFYFGG